jgi:hypothetical protein
VKNSRAGRKTVSKQTAVYWNILERDVKQYINNQLNKQTYGDVTIACEGLQKFRHMPFEQGGIFIVPHLL